MLVLVASLGWGVTRPYLDQPTILKAWCLLMLQHSVDLNGLAALEVQALSCFYIVLDFIRESALSFRCMKKASHDCRVIAIRIGGLPWIRHSHSLSIAFVLLCLLPVCASIWKKWNKTEGCNRIGCFFHPKAIAVHAFRLHYWMVPCLSVMIFESAFAFHSESAKYSAQYPVPVLLRSDFLLDFTALCRPRPLCHRFARRRATWICSQVIFDRDTCRAQATRKSVPGCFENRCPSDPFAETRPHGLRVAECGCARLRVFQRLRLVSGDPHGSTPKRARDGFGPFWPRWKKPKVA